MIGGKSLSDIIIIYLSTYNYFFLIIPYYIVYVCYCVCVYNIWLFNLIMKLRILFSPMVNFSFFVFFILTPIELRKKNRIQRIFIYHDVVEVLVVVNSVLYIYIFIIFIIIELIS